jgi:tetratricopeptide (TPR) repeat protein
MRVGHGLYLYVTPAPGEVLALAILSQSKSRSCRWANTPRCTPALLDIVQDYRETLRLDSNHSHAFVNRSSAYADELQYDRAIQDYNQAARLDPNDIHAFINRGNVSDEKGDYDLAIQDYSRVPRRHVIWGFFFKKTPHR